MHLNSCETGGSSIMTQLKCLLRKNDVDRNSTNMAFARCLAVPVSMSGHAMFFFVFIFSFFSLNVCL